MKKSKIISFIIAAAFLINITACGTILYPERKGQIKGRIDPAVAILDGIGLLCFLVPGVIAFAVDFTNGTIYLPGTSSKLSEDDMKIVKTDQQIDKIYLEKVIQKELGIRVNLDSEYAIVKEISSLNQIPVIEG